MRCLSLIACLSLLACASPRVDTDAADFSATQYADDLEECQGDVTVEGAVRGFGAMLAGSLYGLVHGAVLSKDTDGTLIGLATGGAVGLAAGLAKPISDHNDIVASCLRRKGYRLQVSIRRVTATSAAGETG